MASRRFGNTQSRRGEEADANFEIPDDQKTLLAKLQQLLINGEDDQKTLLAKLLQLLINGEDDQQAPLAKLLQLLINGEVTMSEDASGRLQICHGDDRSRPEWGLIKQEEDKPDPHDLCMEVMRAKRLAPLGVRFNSSMGKITLRIGLYEPGKDFTLRDRLHDNVVMVRDNSSQVSHIMKTVRVDGFNIEEVEVMRDLTNCPRYPDLLMYRLADSNIHLHIGFINGKTINDIRGERTALQLNELLRPFSCVFLYESLGIIEELMGRGWIHGDIHGGNFILCRDTVTIKAIDFGEAKRLQGNELALQVDIKNVIKLFCSLYFKKLIPEQQQYETLRQSLDNLIPGEDKIKEIILAAWNMATLQPDQCGFGDFSRVKELILDAFDPGNVTPEVNLEDKKTSILRRVIVVLYPDSHICSNFSMLPGY